MRFPLSYAQQLNALLCTDRLIIEPIIAAHADLLFDSMQDEAIYRWISRAPPKTLAQLRETWRTLESRLCPDGNEAWLNWAVKRTTDGAYVGKIDAVVDSAHIATNIGYLFFPAFWGHGYAIESVSAVADHFSKQKITKALATVTYGNEASCRVLEKAGFKRNRIIPENESIRGVIYDDVEYVRLFTS